MLGAWCDGHTAAEQLFVRASEILGYDLAAICRTGPAETLNATSVSQPAILVTSLAALEVLKSRDPGMVAACPITAGLSLGEYTALVFAGGNALGAYHAGGYEALQARGIRPGWIVGASIGAVTAAIIAGR